MEKVLRTRNDVYAYLLNKIHRKLMELPDDHYKYTMERYNAGTYSTALTTSNS